MRAKSEVQFVRTTARTSAGALGLGGLGGLDTIVSDLGLKETKASDLSRILTTSGT